MSLPVIDALYAVRAGVTKIKKIIFSLPVMDALCAIRAGGRNEDKIEFFQYAVGYDGKGR